MVSSRAKGRPSGYGRSLRDASAVNGGGPVYPSSLPRSWKFQENRKWQVKVLSLLVEQRFIYSLLYLIAVIDRGQNLPAQCFQNQDNCE